MTESSIVSSLPLWQKSLPYVLFGLLAFLYLVVIPTGESPDEPGHLRCIEQVSIQGQLPTIDPPSQGNIWWHPGAILSGYICYHTPLYYLLTGGTQRLVRAVTGETAAYQFPPHNYDFGPQINLFDHSERKPHPWQLSDPWHILNLRLLSIFLSGVLVWAAMRIAHHFSPHKPLTSVTAGLILAGWPQFVYLSRSLNNDILATALATLVLVLLLDIGRPRRYWLLGLLSALALLTKLTVAFTIVVILIVWILEAWHYRKQIRSYAKNLAICLAIWVSSGLLLIFHPILNQNFNYGIRYISWFSERAATIEYWQEVTILTLSSGWVRFGWMNLAAPLNHVYLAWSLVGMLLIVALIYTMPHLRRQPNAVSSLKAAVLFTWIAISLASYVRINMTHFQPQFRFIFVLLPVLAAITAVGLQSVLSLLPRPLPRYTTILMLSIVWLCYNAWVIWTLVIPAYY